MPLPLVLTSAVVAASAVEAKRKETKEFSNGKLDSSLEELTSEKERVAFVKGLIRLAKVDQKIAIQEIKFLDEIVIRIGLDKKYISKFRKILESKDDLSTIKITFDNKMKSLLFLREAIQLCKADGLYHEKEKAEIDKIAKEMGVSVKAVKKIEKWADRGIKWQREGIELLYLE